MRQAPVAGEHGDAEGEACETEGVVDYGKDFAAAQQRYGNKLAEPAFKQSGAEGNAVFQIFPVVVAKHKMGAVKQKDKVQSQKNGGECKPERTVGLLQAADDNPREIEVAKAFVQRVSGGGRHGSMRKGRRRETDGGRLGCMRKVRRRESGGGRHGSMRKVRRRESGGGNGGCFFCHFLHIMRVGRGAFLVNQTKNICTICLIY